MGNNLPMILTVTRRATCTVYGVFWIHVFVTLAHVYRVLMSTLKNPENLEN